MKIFLVVCDGDECPGHMDHIVGAWALFQDAEDARTEEVKRAARWGEDDGASAPCTGEVEFWDRLYRVEEVFLTPPSGKRVALVGNPVKYDDLASAAPWFTEGVVRNKTQEDK